MIGGKTEFHVKCYGQWGWSNCSFLEEGGQSSGRQPKEEGYFQVDPLIQVKMSPWEKAQEVRGLVFKQRLIQVL